MRFVYLLPEVKTEDKLEYTFFPVSSGSLFFKVRCPNDAHVALTTGPAETEPMYEVSRASLTVCSIGFIRDWQTTRQCHRSHGLR